MGCGNPRRRPSPPADVPPADLPKSPAYPLFPPQTAAHLMAFSDDENVSQTMDGLSIPDSPGTGAPAADRATDPMRAFVPVLRLPTLASALALAILTAPAVAQQAPD